MRNVQTLLKRPRPVPAEPEDKSWLAPERIWPLRAAHVVMALLGTGIAVAAVWLYLDYRSAAEERIIPGELVLVPMFVLGLIGLLVHGDQLHRLRRPELDMVERSDGTMGPGYVQADVQAAARIVAYQTIAPMLILTFALGLVVSWLVGAVVLPFAYKAYRA